MWLVLCDPRDLAALWAYAGLRARGLAPLELLSPQALVGSPRTVHRIDRYGARFEVGLPDGRVLASDDVDGVLNRAVGVAVGPAPPGTVSDTLSDTLSGTEGETKDDRGEAGYVQEELNALLLSLLTCLAPVSVNRPTASGLYGPWRSAAEWTVLAARAGLVVSPLRLTDRPGEAPQRAAAAVTGRVLVLGGHVCGAPADEDPEAYARLARLAGTELLGIDVVGPELPGTDVPPDGGNHRTVFGGADPLPDLRVGGEAFLDRLLDHLKGLSPGPR
ncbi:hypothetical protein [Streptomyces sp. 1331.2]|uniref:hypothetical protein n=1 Tax=Streptomyces sp. 1331.2 TaxID=1938835 RepID=UPI000BD21597|nr:hypothetical protein [Streptomyces sp. 1331.2]SOB86327.1 hypothetical protein SAMN06272789_6638 [Streptomyces sp. 1331.2]